MLAAALVSVLEAQTRAVTATAAPQAAATDYFLKLDGVRGESTNKDHKEWIEVLSYSWGASNARPTQAGARGQVPTGPGTLTITRVYDKASPVLAKRCSADQKPQNVVIHLPSGTPGAYTEHVLHGATATGCSQSGTTESVSFNFEKITTGLARPNAQPATLTR
jgi:type VI protein secretion system component Hcp